MLTLLLAACSGDDGSTVAVEVSSPVRGAFLSAGEVTVTGTVTGTTNVEINGETVAVAGDGSFEHVVAVGLGTNIIETIAIGERGQEASDRRAISSGALVAAAPVADALVVAFRTRGLASLGQSIKASVDQPALDAELVASLLVDSGTGCTRDLVSITATGTPLDEVFLYGVLDQLDGDVLFLPVNLTLSADYMDGACAPQTGSFTFDTEELHWTYTLDLALTANETTPISVSFINTGTLYDHPLFYTNNDIDPTVFDRVTSAVDANLATRLVELSTTELETRASQALNAFGGSSDWSIGSETLALSIRPTGVSTGAADGLVIVFEWEMSAAAATEPGHVATPSDAVSPGGFDAAMTISDDALDQALGLAWRTGAFDTQLQSGATLELLVPPVVRDVAGKPVVVVGDWVAAVGDAKVSISGRVPLEADVDGASLRLQPLAPLLLANPFAGDVSQDDASALADEAAGTLRAVLSELLASAALPIAEHAASALVATMTDGYVEISIDLD